MKFDLMDFFAPMMAFILGCLVTIVGVQTIVIDPMKNEAIKKGYASWEIVDNSTGRTQFKFK